MSPLLYFAVVLLESLLIIGAISIFLTRAIIVYGKLKMYKTLHIPKNYEFKVINLKHKGKIKWQTNFGSDQRWKICALENINGRALLIYAREKIGH